MPMYNPRDCIDGLRERMTQYEQEGGFGEVRRDRAHSFCFTDWCKLSWTVSAEENEENECSRME